jgi:putative restriction endonuclease
MTKLVLMHKAESIYDDEPDRVYDFPRSYLKAVREGVGDWIVYLEPAKAGPRGYFAVAKIEDVVPKPGVAGRYLARIAPDSFLPFDREVARLQDGRPIESALAGSDGMSKKGGAVQLAVRRLPDAEFARIVDLGLPADLEAIEARRWGVEDGGFEEAARPFERPVLERLTRRPYRDVAFRRKVREAYAFRCAMSGLELRNGGGRPEVQAAHIRPVQKGGSDSVRNGLALSGTLHWMFDRGLISVAPDSRTILVSENKVPGDVIHRLLPADRRVIPPRDPRDAPHPANLAWHRENVYGQVLSEDAPPWQGRPTG